MSAQDDVDCIPERELSELFEPRRAEPQQFREGVERRIEKLRAEKAKADATPAPSWIRRVASMFPGDLLAGAVGGSAAGKIAAAKLLPATLALPVVLLGSALGAFAAGSRSLRRSTANAAPPHPRRKWSLKGPPHNTDLRIGSSLQQLIGFLFLFGLFAVPGFAGTDVVLVVLVISMAALTISMRGFASAGLLTRPQVSHLSTSVLMSAFTSGFWLTSLFMAEASSELGIGWSAGIVLAGGAMCFFLSPRTALGNFNACAFGLAVLLVNPVGCTRSSPASLRAQLESMELVPAELSKWGEAAALHRALQLTGGPSADLSAARSRLEATIESGIDEHPGVWAAALEMELIDAEHLARLRDISSVRSELEGVRSAAAPLKYLRFDQVAVTLLKEEARRDPDLRDRIADQLEVNWPKEGDHGAPEDAWLCVRGLDEIGASERADALREMAHSLLVTHWIADADFMGARGGFTPDPVEFRTSFKDVTWCAVQLMERLGVPPEIDLRLLRGYLRNESQVKLLDMSAYLNAEARAALRVLEDCIGMPERNFLRRILDERLLIASLLLVALCLTAIRLAPSPESDTREGALP